MMDHKEGQMIDCQEAERRLHGYLDRKLSDVEAVEVQRHLEACENCRARFRFERGLRRLVYRAARNETTPAGLRERIQRRHLQ